MKGVKIDSTISTRGSRTQRRNRSMSQPTPMPHSTSPHTMAANVPAVFLGEAVTRVVPLKYVRYAAAALFAGIGAWIAVAALTGG